MDDLALNDTVYWASGTKVMVWLKFTSYTLAEVVSATAKYEVMLLAAAAPPSQLVAPFEKSPFVTSSEPATGGSAAAAPTKVMSSK